MTSYLQVLGASGPDSPPSLLLFFDQCRYLINAPEGIQRLATTHSIRLSKIHHVLLTRSSTRTLGGLPGLCITVADLGVRKLTVMGAEGLAEVLRGVRGFSVRSRMELNVHELQEGQDVKGDAVTVRAVLMGTVHRRMRTVPDPVPTPAQPQRLSPLPAASLYHTEDDLAMALSPSSPSPSPVPSDLPTTPRPYTVPFPVLSYILTLPPAPGKFLPDRARALGLPPSPLYSRLKAGQDVLSPSGQVVRATDCVEATKPGRVMGVVDVPWVGTRRVDRWVRRLRTMDVWRRYHEGGEVMSVLVHLVGGRVLRHPVYAEWMRLFGGATQHVLINAEVAVPRSIFDASVLLHRRLQAIDPEAFHCDPLLCAAPDAVPATRALVQRMIRDGLVPPTSVAGEPLMRLPLLPLTTPCTPVYDTARPSPPVDPAPEQQWAAAIASYKEQRRALLSTVQVSSAPVPYSPDLPSPFVDDAPPSLPTGPFAFHPAPDILHRLFLLPTSLSPQLTFLGTGSAIPSKYRNVTGIFFHPGHRDGPGGLHGGVMLDCGEGTLGQCVRKWGLHGAKAIVGSLSLVFVSHMHADHHLGLQSIVGAYVEEERRRRRAGEKERRLWVVGPRKLRPWLLTHWQHAYEESVLADHDGWDETKADVDEAKDAAADDADGEVEEEVIDDELFDFIEYYSCHALLSAPHDLSPLLAALPVPLSLTTVPVRHCPDSYGVSLHTLTGSAGALPWKLVYSGDTLPSSALVQHGLHATVVVHEATFEDGMEAEARDKRHCTARQAVEVGRGMGAQSLLLTHFSQRYPKMSDVGGGEAGWVAQRVVQAFDLMTVAWRDLYWLPALMPAIAGVVGEGGAVVDDDDGDDGEDERTAVVVDGANGEEGKRAVSDTRKRVDRAQPASASGKRSKLQGAAAAAAVARTAALEPQ